MSPRRPPHDALFKAAFSDVRSLLGELEALLPGEVVEAIDFSTAELVPGSFVDEELRDHHTDVLWSLRLADRGALLYVLLEHQSSPDPLMAFRLLRYMVRIWERWLRSNPGAGQLPAILPVVVFQGPGAWRTARSFDELVDLPAEIHPAMRRFLPSFEMLLDELGECSEEELRQRNAATLGRVALLLLRSARETEDLLGLVSSVADLLVELSDDQEGLVMVLSYTLEVGDLPVEELRDLLAAEVGPRAAEVVMTTAEKLIQQGIEEGLEKGLEQGVEQGRTEERRDLLLRLVESRFGEPSPSQIERIRSASAGELGQWIDRLLTAGSLDELLA